MALQKKIIPIITDGGINTKIAQEVLPPNMFTDLRNVIRRKAGKFEKFRGMYAMYNDTFDDIPAATVSQGSTIFTTDNETVIIDDDGGVYSDAGASSEWVCKGFVPHYTSTIETYNRTSRDISANHNVLTNATSRFFVWEEEDGVHYCIQDKASGTFYTYRTTTSGVNTAFVQTVVRASRKLPVACFISDDEVFLAYTNGSNTSYGEVINITNPSLTTLPTVKTLSSVIDTTVTHNVHDVCRGDTGYVYYSYITNESSTVKVRTSKINTSVSVTSSNVTSGLGIATSGNVCNCYSAAGNSGSPFIHVIFVTSARNAQYILYDTSMNEDNFQTVTDGNIQRLTAVTNDAGTLYAYYEKYSATSGYTVELDSYSVTTSSYYSIPTITDTVTQATIATKPWVNPTSRPGIGVIGSKLQSSTYGSFTIVNQSDTNQPFLRASQYATEACYRQKVFGSGYAYNQHKVVSTVDSNTYEFCVVSDRLNVVTLDYTASSVEDRSVAKLGRSSYIAAEGLYSYDGASVVEAGFFCGAPDATIIASGTGSFTGDFIVSLVHEWYDANGERHQSSLKTTEVTASSDNIVITYYPTNLTNRPTNEIYLAIYMTEANGTILYRNSSFTYQQTTTLTAQTITVTSGVSTSEERLYTSGGVLANDPPASTDFVVEHNNRLAVIDKEKNYIHYSKTHLDGEPVNFSGLFKLPIPVTTIDSVGEASINDKLIIFKERSIYYVTGEGPADDGSQDDFITPEEITKSLGCINRKSIVQTTEGVFFQSHKGIYLLSRDLSLVPVGDAIEDYLTGNITSAVELYDEDEVRFSTDDGLVLCFNYEFNNWSILDNVDIVSAASNSNNPYVGITSAGRVLNTTTSETTDYVVYDGSITTNILNKLETGWISLNGLQGYSRIYSILLLGEHITDHKFRVKLAYNNVDTYIDSWTYDTSTISLTTRWQFRVQPSVQQCQSIKILIEELDPDSGNTADSFKFIGMSFEVGVRPDLYYTPKTIG